MMLTKVIAHLLMLYILQLTHTVSSAGRPKNKLTVIDRQHGFLENSVRRILSGLRMIYTYNDVSFVEEPDKCISWGLFHPPNNIWLTISQRPHTSNNTRSTQQCFWTPDHFSETGLILQSHASGKVCKMIQNIDTSQYDIVKSHHNMLR